MHLTADDAVFVDVIHTDTGSSDDITSSFPKHYGHLEILTADNYQTPKLLKESTNCNHGIARLYFLDSIRRPGTF